MVTLRHLTAIGLVGVMLFFTLLNTIAVKCLTENGQHQVIKPVGHPTVSVMSCDEHHACASPQAEQHEHPIECMDEPILSDIIASRSSVDVEQPQASATILPTVELAVLLIVDPASELQRCPRPPPDRLRSAVDDFLNLRLLV